jgi:hypothetical protein
LPAFDPRPAEAAVDGLVAEVSTRLLAVHADDRVDYVGSELAAVHRVLARIRAEGLAQGLLFCEWGSGLGGVCGIAALSGFTPYGIEIESELVDSARSMAKSLDLPTIFAQGTFLLPGDEDLAVATPRTRLVFDRNAWEELGLAPGDCHVVFAYPWPGEEAFVDSVFARHASPGALLLTFHDWSRVFVQRKLVDSPKLLPVGWM